MTITNNPARAAFVAIATEVKAHGGRMAKLVAPLTKLEITAADISGKGKYYADLKDAVAQAYLTPAQYKVFSDATLSQAEGTARGKYVRNVSSSVSKVRAAIVRELAAPAEKRGPSERKTFDQVMLVQIDAWVKRIVENKDKDSFNMEADPIEVKAALMAVAKILR
jgi:hypothetical protein